MKQRVRVILISLLSLLLVVGIITTGFIRGWHIKKYEPEELASFLRPFYQINRPQGDGPFPTVIGFHGCGGVDLGVVDWMSYLRDHGYATVLVDSATPRAWNPDLVCNGRTFWGSERAGDVLAASIDIGQLPFVDASRLILIGWSHGAWATMDLVAMNPPIEMPTNLLDSPARLPTGVKGIVLFYPYCGFAARTRKGQFEPDIPTLMLPSTSGQRGDLLTLHTYPEANHAFDMRQEDLFGGFRPHRESMIDARARVREFLEHVLVPQRTN